MIDNAACRLLVYLSRLLRVKIFIISGKLWHHMQLIVVLRLTKRVIR